MRSMYGQWASVYISTGEEAKWPSTSPTSLNEDMERADGSDTAEAG